MHPRFRSASRRGALCVASAVSFVHASAAHGQQPGGMGAVAGMASQTMGAVGLVPPGIMVGQARQWMIGYQVAFDEMSGNLVGANRVGDAAVLQQFASSPTDMAMHMQMAMAMYAPSNRVTLMAMAPFISKAMNHISGDGARFAEHTNGFGDLELRALLLLHSVAELRHRFLLNAGITVPSASINRTMDGMRLEYPMQLGAGTVAFSPGVTYLGQLVPWGWGAEFIPTLRGGTNRNGYRLGNRYQPSAWIARQTTRWLSLSARAEGDLWQNVQGADAALDRADEPTKDPTLQGGRRLDVALGMSVHPTNGFLRGQEFFSHVGTPAWQSLNGPQLRRRWTARVGWQGTLH